MNLNERKYNLVQVNTLYSFPSVIFSKLKNMNKTSATYKKVYKAVQGVQGHLFLSVSKAWTLLNRCTRGD